ncbi:MAG: hypothetical protein AAFP20_12355 [Cyanobacteria bacterium J06614_10]
MLGDVLYPAASGRRRRRRESILLKYVQQSLLTAVAFVLAASLLNQIIPSPSIPANVVFVGPKYEFYKAHKDDYTALFFGSSRVFNQVIPDVFDQTASAEGIQVNSYNFGVPAMRALDSAVLLEEVLKHPPKNLKWVFFESVLDKGYEPIQNARTHRAMYWHTWENTRLAARYILTSEESLPGKTALLTSHLLPALYRQLNVGRLFNQVLPSEFSAEEIAVTEEFTANEGFRPLNDPEAPKRLAFLNNQVGYQKQVEKLTKRLAKSATADPSLPPNKRMLLARISQTIRETGAEPIFIEPPSLELDMDFQAAKALGEIDTLLSYKDPQAFPYLYKPDNRFDADHLTPSASDQFSRLLAKDFSRALQSEDSTGLNNAGPNSAGPNSAGPNSAGLNKT